MDIDELVADVLPPMRVAVVDDARTADALGNRVFRALKDRFAAVHVTLEGFPKACNATAQRLRMQTLSCDALVAVGGGTINDLCKFVSHQDKKPYLVFPTAASMNGYGSANASISVGGYKKTKAAQMPRAIFCDMLAIAQAPARLDKAGFADSLARSTAQADWLLSHLLLSTPYDPLPFELLAETEPQLFDHARGVALGDPASIRLLMQTLLLSGFGMTLAGGSYPASGGEHMIAHAYEMAFGGDALHGETIAVTAPYMADLQQRLLRSAPRLRPDDFDARTLGAMYGEQTASEAAQAFGAKQALMSGRPGVFSGWDEIAEKISAIHLPPERLAALLDAADIPSAPSSIGWDAASFHQAAATARYLRDRFGFLDLE